ncbi:MAG: hypothetical protein ACR2ID_11000 [Chthoniobacterales bacterium]
MTTHRKLLILTVLAGSALAPLASAHAQGISIAIGDRPYYSHGPAYWDNDTHYVWVPGHRGRYNRGWVRGHYVARERRGPIERLRDRHRVHRAILFGR